ncbi:Predicted membrane protein [Candidatus Ornithobacterium hominis]|uniref:Predicted membrane protein n=1 Tax=Candidatus Ornithobacterium hominis TaxID=2497989 RepID=A0A383TX86_9FLAO|nr:DUF1648 domain-containing protein [Candidatus Ornithobacterium hominis]MCT7904814.1 DUF1648 domain-containing protein [Candidatus Ornithobacterium hominis]CAI9429392.1 putative membrane protein [Candidatus Ornithobacterium hominis]SZD71586.1 Predicted membrane protein [Candidatus Ornithobacterium hominis]SZD72197.1 Predicted membrane protein [Candidatus Ornithobacterium hominis]
MIKKNILIVFLISVSILILNCYFVFTNYDNISNEIITHIDITGKPNGYGNKVNLIYAMLANFLLIFIIFLGIKYPKYANYPIEINNRNRKTAYQKMQMFLAIISIITSLAFSYMVFLAVGKQESMIYIILYSIISTLTILFYFKTNE